MAGWFSKLLLMGALMLGTGDPLDRMAADTWQSFVEMTGDNGLTDDHIMVVDGTKVLPKHTSPTNVAMYMMAVTSAKNLDIIGQAEAESRLKTTLGTLAKLERSHGLFLNWYDPDTGLRIEKWNPGGHVVNPFLSSVDNAWLALGLMHVAEVYEPLRQDAKKILSGMNFAFLYNKEVGAFYGGWDVSCGKYTPYSYTLLYSETRLVSYVAAKLGQVPRDEMKRLVTARRSGVMLSCYGSVFEALAVPLYIPEMEDEQWAEVHRSYLKSHIREAGGRIWGLSYSDDALGVYKEFGIDDLALYPAHYGKEWVVTPYSSFLSLQVNRPEALKNIARLEDRCYGKYGFYGAYNPATGAVSQRVLCLEQGLILAAIAHDRKKSPCQPLFRDLVTAGPVF